MFDFDSEGGFKKHRMKIASAAALLLLGGYMTSEDGSKLAVKIKDKVKEQIQREPASVEKVEAPKVETVTKQPKRQRRRFAPKTVRTSVGIGRQDSYTPQRSPSPPSSGSSAGPAMGGSSSSVFEGLLSSNQEPAPVVESSSPSVISNNDEPQESVVNNGGTAGPIMGGAPPVVGFGGAVNNNDDEDQESDNDIISFTTTSTDSLVGIGDVVSIDVNFEGAISLSGNAVITLSSTNGEHRFVSVVMLFQEAL
jgi:hypothetical protein